MTDRSSWWEDIDADLAAAGAEAEELPDPWAGADVDGLALTADQEAFLAGLDDQHPVPRLTGLTTGDQPGPATGSLPGDSETGGS